MDGAKAVEGVDEIPPDDAPIIFTRMITIVSEKRQNAIDVTCSNLPGGCGGDHGRRVVSRSRDKTLKVWDLETGALI